MHYLFYGGHMIWMTISWLVGFGLLVTFIWLLVAALRGPAGEPDTDEYERHLDEFRKTKPPRKNDVSVVVRKPQSRVRAATTGWSDFTILD